MYDTTLVTSEEMNDFITQNPFEAQVKFGYHFIYDFLVNYDFDFGLQPMVHFQYFKGSGDEFDRPVPFEFTKNSGVIFAIRSLTELEGGNSGTLRIFLKQNFQKLVKSKFDLILGFGTSVFGKNAQGETNVLFGLTGYF